MSGSRVDERIRLTAGCGLLHFKVQVGSGRTTEFYCVAELCCVSEERSGKANEQTDSVSQDAERMLNSHFSFILVECSRAMRHVPYISRPISGVESFRIRRVEHI